jgi:hypothetical protein
VEWIQIFHGFLFLCFYYPLGLFSLENFPIFAQETHVDFSHPRSNLYPSRILMSFNPQGVKVSLVLFVSLLQLTDFLVEKVALHMLSSQIDCILCFYLSRTISRCTFWHCKSIITS